MSGSERTVMDQIHAEARDRELLRRAEARLTEKLLRVTEELLRAERELHELKLQRLHRKHWVKIRRLREARNVRRVRLDGGDAALLRKERDEARRERDALGQTLERVRRVAPNAVDIALGREDPESMPMAEVAVLHTNDEQE